MLGLVSITLEVEVVDDTLVTSLFSGAQDD